MCYYVVVMQDNTITNNIEKLLKVTRNGRTDISYMVSQQLKLRARLFGEMFVEIGKCVIDDFVA